MTPYLSTKIRAISFLSIVGVVCIHATNLQFRDASGAVTLPFDSAATLIQKFVGGGLASVAVPFFFLFSGYLFFRDINRSSSAVVFLAEKMNRRTRTLLVPYVAWSTLGFMFFYAVGRLKNLERLRSAWSLPDDAFSAYLHALALPVLFHLWFLQDLIVYVLLSPLIYLLMQRFRAATLLLCLAVYASQPPFRLADLGEYAFIRSDGLFFFLAGAALHGWDGLTPAYLAQRKRLLGVAWLGLMVAFLGTQDSGKGWEVNAVGVAMTLVGIPTVWVWYDVYADRCASLVRPVAGSTFFIYAFHEPLVTITKKIGNILLGFSQVSSFVVYCTTIVAALGICIALASVLRARVPLLYAVLTGGR